MKKIAVIQFPGSNCERETKTAFELSPHQVDIVRWNISETAFHQYDAYVLPGGFSYQDRVRAGAIPAKLPIIRLLKQADQANKAILGICNGCQILAESGLIPGSEQLEIALGRNSIKDAQIGFLCDWVYVKAIHNDQNIFTRSLPKDGVLPIPINHGEGRFILDDKAQPLLDQVSQFRYCDASGAIVDKFPINPNGSMLNIAGIGNKKGNVFAMMPHPERAAFPKQIPVTVARRLSGPVLNWQDFFSGFLSSL